MQSSSISIALVIHSKTYADKFTELYKTEPNDVLIQVNDNIFDIDKGTEQVKEQSQHLQEQPAPYNSVTIHGYSAQFNECIEKPTQEDNAYKKPRNDQHVALIHRLRDLIPPPAFPDSSVPLLRELDLKSRNEFIKCVLIMVLIMIIITALFTVYVLITPEIKQYFKVRGWEILLPAILLLVLADCGIICFLCARSAPWNFIYLVLTVIPMSLLAAKISVFFNTEVVFYAILSTGVIVFICILLACSTFNFTNRKVFVLMVAIAFTTLTIVIYVEAAITGKIMQPLVIVILYGSTLFQIIMFTIQLQMILGMNSVVQIGVEDYCLAAFLLYNSTLDVFIRSVYIYGFVNNNH